MITFIAITAIVNLALGYGLAIYLGHASLGYAKPGFTGMALSAKKTADEVTVFTPVSEQTDDRAEQVPSVDSDVAEQEIEENSLEEQATDSSPEPPVDESDSQPPSEEDLLAGIATFQDQLTEANLKSDVADAEAEVGMPTETSPV